jgi:hypothetical protein
MPAPNVKSSSQASGKWSRRASSAGQEYSQGVETTTADWQAATVASKAAYLAGVQEAQGRDAFARGAAAAGTQRWRANALKKGPGRFTEGVGLATDDYARGIQPFLEAAGRTDLPMRGPVGSEANYNRAATMAKAFRALKTGRK